MKTKVSIGKKVNTEYGVGKVIRVMSDHIWIRIPEKVSILFVKLKIGKYK